MRVKVILQERSMQQAHEDASGPAAWRSGSYLLLPDQRKLLHEGKLVLVEERVLDLILLLVGQHHRTLPQREITIALWGQRPVSDNTLRQVVYKARRALGDDGEHQAIIRTLHGRSLQWVAAVEALSAEEVNSLLEARQAKPRWHLRRRWLWAAAFALVLVVALGLWTRDARAPLEGSVTRVAIEPISNDSGDKSLDWAVNGLPGLLASLLGQSGGIDVVDPLQSLRAWDYQPQQGRTREQQLRFSTGADTLVGGRLRKLTAQLYELSLHVDIGKASHANFVLTGEKPSMLAVNALPRIRHALGLDKPKTPSKLPHDAFLAEAYARGLDLSARGHWQESIEYFRLCQSGAPDFLPAILSLGVGQTMVNDLAAGKRTLRGLTAVAQAHENAPLAGRSLLWQSHLAINLHQDADALKYAEKALPYLRQALDADGEITAHAVAAIAAGKLGQLATARRELSVGQALYARQPELLRARGILYDAQAELAQFEGNLDKQVAMIRKGLALRESLGDERDVVVSLNNLGSALAQNGQFSDALSVIARAGKRAREGHYGELEFDTNFNLLHTMLFSALDDQVVAGSGVVFAQAAQFGFAPPWPARVMNIRGTAQMDGGDAAAALASLLQSEAKFRRAQEHPADIVVELMLYEAYAAFESESVELGGINARLVHLIAANKSKPEYGAWTFAPFVTQALLLAAHNDKKGAGRALNAALSEAHRSHVDPSPVRPAALLIALAENDRAAAFMGMQGFQPESELDALQLRLAAEWASKAGDSATTVAATSRLAFLRKQGEHALSAGGLDPGDPVGRMSLAYGTGKIGH